MGEVLRPLGGHAVFLLLVQLALLIAVARLGAELARRLGLPAVVGELAAGIALGPSLFGRLAPAFFLAVFPRDAAQFHLLDAMGTLGMCLLLLLTGLETDVRLLRNLGKSALAASASGMVLPFVLGFVLGLFMPSAYLASPDRRVLFSFFLATAMSISAMPVIAKILVDLDLTRRNLGLVILSAGVVDDTVGWVILSLIAGAASSSGAGVGQLALTLVLLPAFLAAAAFALHPALRWLMRVASERFKSPDTDLVAIFVVTLLCAAATEAIGVHAVFGAFVAGVVLHQVPAVRRETVHRLESFVMAVLAPVFFGIVGLKVDLSALGGGGGVALAVVLAVACLGKLVGCTAGGLWSGMRFWEAASIAVAMNARGAMEIVVATIGLSLGILTPAMFSIIVVVAIATSFMAPLGLRLTVPRVRLTEEETRRIEQEAGRGTFDPRRLRVLLAAGGEASLKVAAVAFALARKSEHPVTILHVERETGWGDRLWGLFGRTEEGRNVRAHLDAVRALAPADRPVELREVASGDVARAICEEASRGADLVVLGTAPDARTLEGRALEGVVARAPCHIAIVRPTTSMGTTFKHILVPVDGSAVARLAAEFALRCAELMGCALTLATLHEGRPQVEALAEGEAALAPGLAVGESGLDRISPAFRASDVKPSVLELRHDPTTPALEGLLRSGDYDLVVLGAENRAIQNRLFFGYENERFVRESAVPIIVVVPRLKHTGA